MNVLPSTNLTTNKSNTKHQISLKPYFSTSVNKALHPNIDITNSPLLQPNISNYISNET